MAIPWKRWIGRLLAACLVALRRTCRYEVVDDPRPALRAADIPYVYALLHAHQISAVFVNDEAPGRLAAMVSRSADGDLLVPSLDARGVRAARGSSRTRSREKGGREALEILAEWLEQRIAVLLAVDGPNGPRNVAKAGVARIALGVPGAVVLPTVVVASPRWPVGIAWDRIQVPLPFSKVSLVFAEPIRPQPGEDVETLRLRIEKELNLLEAAWDPGESARASAARRSDG